MTKSSNENWEIENSMKIATLRVVARRAKNWKLIIRTERSEVRIIGFGLFPVRSPLLGEWEVLKSIGSN